MVFGVERQRLIAGCVCFVVMLVGTSIILYNYRMRLYAIQVERLRSEVGDVERIKTRLHDLLTKKKIEETNYRRLIKNKDKEREKLENTINELEAKLKNGDSGAKLYRISEDSNELGNVITVETSTDFHNQNLILHLRIDRIVSNYILCLLRSLYNKAGIMVLGSRHRRSIAVRVFFVFILVGSLALFYGYRMPSHKKEAERLRSEILTFENMRARLNDVLNMKDNVGKSYEQIVKEKFEEMRKLKQKSEQLEAEIDRLRIVYT
uniref:Uncharacterized protein n=1 Tax=Glossina pallidipes TaxID=7398 RepID=A0A1A9ZQN8_GLOPL